MRVVVAGYYGFGNLGDELILKALLEQLRQAYPSVVITVLSNDPTQTREKHGVVSVSRWNPVAVFVALWRADMLVLGGGGLLQDQTSARSILYYLSLVRAAAFIGTAVFLYAIGVESLRRPYLRRLTAKTLNDSFVTISVRDQDSQRALVACGVSDWKIKLTNDPVFSLPFQPIIPDTAVSIPMRALIIPRANMPAEGQALLKRIASALSNEGYAIDSILFQEIREKKEWPDAISAESLEQLEWLYGMCGYVVSARFHGLVLAAMAGKPFLGIGDYEKVGRLCEACRMPYLPWTPTEKQFLDALTILYLKSSEQSYERLDDWRLQAKETFHHAL